jgi:hypothetical protein
MIIMEVVATCFNSRATPWCRGRIQKVGYIEVDTWQLPRNSPYRIESDAARRKLEEDLPPPSLDNTKPLKVRAEFYFTILLLYD